jgi:hypothetical protein
MMTLQADGKSFGFTRLGQKGKDRNNSLVVLSQQ